jgi:hypothetical protein
MKNRVIDTFWGRVGSSGAELPSYETERLNVLTGIRLEGEEIRWNPQNTAFTTVDLDKELVRDFSGLALVEAESVLEFAQRWGVLGLCKHGFPATHNSPSIFGIGRSASVSCRPTGSESVEVWRRWARISRAMISIASSIQKGEIGGREDWQVLGVSPASQPDEITSAESLIERYANVWLDLGGIRPRVKFRPARIHISFLSNGGLFGALAIQLMQSVIGTHGPLVCSACGKIYDPASYDRRPRAGERNYCSGCGKEAAKRDALRDFRRRQKATS